MKKCAEDSGTFNSKRNENEWLEQVLYNLGKMWASNALCVCLGEQVCFLLKRHY